MSSPTVGQLAENVTDVVGEVLSTGKDLATDAARHLPEVTESLGDIARSTASTVADLATTAIALAPFTAKATSRRRPWWLSGARSRRPGRRGRMVEAVPECRRRCRRRVERRQQRGAAHPLEFGRHGLTARWGLPQPPVAGPSASSPVWGRTVPRRGSGCVRLRIPQPNAPRSRRVDNDGLSAPLAGTAHLQRLRRRVHDRVTPTPVRRTVIRSS